MRCFQRQPSVPPPPPLPWPHVSVVGTFRTARRRFAERAACAGWVSNRRGETFSLDTHEQGTEVRCEGSKYGRPALALCWRGSGLLSDV